MPLTVDASISSIAPELRGDSSRLALDCYVSADTQYRALSRRRRAGTHRAVPKYLEKLAELVDCGAYGFKESRAT